MVVYDAVYETLRRYIFMERPEEKGAFVVFEIAYGMKGDERYQVSTLIENILPLFPSLMPYQGAGDDAEEADDPGIQF